MGHEVVGTLWQVFHWGPLVALSVIFTISAVAMKCNAMWWPPFNSTGGFIHLIIFLTWVTLTLYNYFMAMFKGPGFVPHGWKPVSVFVQAPITKLCATLGELCMWSSLSGSSGLKPVLLVTKIFPSLVDLTKYFGICSYFYAVVP